MTRLRLRLMCFIFCCVSWQGHTSVLEQVSYGALAELPQRSADDVFEYGDDPLQRIYYWRANGEPKASVIFVHGGCWLNAYDIDHSIGFLTDLANQGYAVYGVEYRRTGDPGGSWPGTLDDIVVALNEVVMHVNKAMPVHVLGHSAGGHLALLASPELTLVDSVVGLAAITDIERYAQGENSCQSATQAFMQNAPEHAPSAWYDANPRNLTMPDSVILLHGSKDGIVPVAQADWPGVAKKRVEGAGHFDWLHPGSSAYMTLLTVLKEQNDKATPER